MTRRKVRFWTVLAALIVLGGAVLAFGLAEAVRAPIQRRATIVIPEWPKAMPPVHVALLADIHLGNRAMTATRLRTIVGQVNRAKPDLVLIAGDFVTGSGAEGSAERVAGLRAPLAVLDAPFGVIAVLGNHDHWTAPDAVRVALQRAGIVVLENQTVRRGPLAIVGVDDVFSGHDNVAEALGEASRMGGIRVVLTHSPDLVHKLPPGAQLVLAGHTHCGQVVVPWIGPVMTLSPMQHWMSIYDPRYRCGIVRDRGRTVVVTAGLGSGSSPIRIGAPPDWWLLTLQGPASESAGAFAEAVPLVRDATH